MIIKEISKSEFEKRFPNVNTYGSCCTVCYLEDGVILFPDEWNGEEYIVDEKVINPFSNGVKI